MEDKVLFDNMQSSSRFIAFFSFLAGTILLLLYLHYNVESILIYGFYYVIVAVVINFIVLVLLLIMFAHRYVDYRENIISIGAVLVNIPIAILYLNVVFNSFS